MRLIKENCARGERERERKKERLNKEKKRQKDDKIKTNIEREMLYKEINISFRKIMRDDVRVKKD